jgi:nucleotide-binding universal stress UspA family protein
MKTLSHPEGETYSAESWSTPLGIERILVALDFSAESHSALRYAVMLGKKFGSTLMLVHVVEPVLSAPEVIIPECTSDRVAKQAMGELRDLADEISDGCRVVETAVRRGIAFFEIIEAAKAMGADLLVVGTHGRTGLSRALLGSTAEKVMRHAPCPVMVVHRSNHRG